MTEATAIDVARALTDNVRKYLDAVLPRMVALAVKEAVLHVKREPGPPGEPGEKGDRGEDGIDGTPGADGKEGIQGEKGLDGKDGKDGADGLHGKDGEPGKRGEKGIDGKDGRDGREGKDGKDGITVEQLETATLKALGAALGEIRLDGRKLMIGDHLIQTLAFPEDRGVYLADTDYEPGDIVSFGGSGWICKRATRDKPGTSDAWRLMIKKGRDGRDNDPRPPQGPVKR